MTTISNLIAQSLREGSYGGVRILIEDSEVVGGRKLAIKQIPNSDLQIVEDLGKKARKFTITGTVSGSTRTSSEFNAEASDYYSDRDLLLKKLELGGGQILSHPWYGKVENVHCVEYTISESTSSIGDSPIQLSMEVGTSVGNLVEDSIGVQFSALVDDMSEVNKVQLIPKEDISNDIDNSLGLGVNISQGVSIEDIDLPSSGSTKILSPLLSVSPSGVTTLVPDTLISVVVSGVGISLEGFEVHSPFLDVLTSVGDYIDKAIKLKGTIISKIAVVTNLLTKFQNNIAALAAIPGQLADAIDGLFVALNSAFASFKNLIDVFGSFFGFGDNNDPLIGLTTSSIKTRVINEKLIKCLIQSKALSYSYLNATEIDYESLEDVDSMAQYLENQYQKMIGGGFLDTTTQYLLTRMRADAEVFFDSQRLIARKIITIETSPTTARLLSYQYYGSSSSGLTIMRLNQLRDPYLLEGDIRILTN